MQERVARGPGANRSFKPALAVAAVLGFALALHAVVVAYVGQYSAPGYIRAGVIIVSAAIMIASHPLARMAGRLPAGLALAGQVLGWAVDLALFANLVWATSLFLHEVANPDALILSYPHDQIASAVLAILTLLELTRRAFGPILSVVGLVALAYVFWGANSPGILSHGGFTPEMLVETVWFGFQGVFGFAAGVVVLVVFIFIVFGAALEGSGAGDLMIRMALWVTGRTRGGAGHAAIVASGVFGMSSGSVVANVVGTGTVTIPLIKQRGFSGRFAGGLEAAASTGGQIMPPVMGAGAFLMAQLTGNSYATVCLAALIPALLYYLSLFISVETEARRLGIEPVPAKDRQALLPGDGVKSLMFFLPVAAILATLSMGRSPSMAGFWAVVTTVAAGFALNPRLRARPMIMIRALARGGIAGAQVMMAVGTIGILIGIFEMTGLGLRFASEVSTLTTTGLFVPLVLAACACLVLGMGMPSLPAYLIIVLVLGASIQKLGVPILAVHLFVFYFGILSAITPPVAIAGVAAAPIAGADPIGTSVVALRLSFTAFIIPFFFVYEPSILLVVEPFRPLVFLWAMLRLIAAIWLINAALGGYLGGRLTLAERAAFLVGSLALLIHTTQVQIGGVALIAMLAAWTWRRQSNIEKGGTCDVTQ